MANIAKIADQLGLEILPENKTHKNRMEIRSETSNRIYVIAQAKTSGEWQCSCPGWILKRAGKDRGCKHLKAILPALESAGKQRKRIS